jgi:hypothetical protein
LEVKMNFRSARANLTYQRQRPARLFLAGASVALAVAVLAGCGGSGGQATQLPAPTFGSLEIPDPSGSNNWVTFSTNSPPAAVLPTRGRGVRVNFYAPVGSKFSVSLSPLAGPEPVRPHRTQVATLTENTGTPAPPEAGYFQIFAEHPSGSQAIYRMYVRAPLSLRDPANYDILVVNRSLRSDQTDSNPMVVPLRHRPVYTVTVQVIGNGRVISTPGGIECGTGSLGALTQCSHEFGPGTVHLDPNSNNDPNAPNPTTRFKGWEGNCPDGVGSCTITLDGTAPYAAKATFVPTSNTDSPPTASAPQIPGLRWIDQPECAGGPPPGGQMDQHPGIGLRSDAAGYFCCEPKPAGSTAPGSPRCFGDTESLPDCFHHSPTGFLRQPGGCYEYIGQL